MKSIYKKNQESEMIRHLDALRRDEQRLENESTVDNESSKD